MAIFGGIISIISIAALFCSIFLGLFNIIKKNGKKSGRKLAIGSAIFIFIGFTISNIFEKSESKKEEPKTEQSTTKKTSSKESYKKHSNKKENTSDSKEAKLNKQVQAGFKDIGGSEEYPLIGHVTANVSNGELKGVSVWGDESLSDVSAQELKHYFSAGAQIGNYVFDHDKDDDNDMKVPFVQVYAGNTKIARSDFSNNSQMKDLR